MHVLHRVDAVADHRLHVVDAAGDRPRRPAILIAQPVEVFPQARGDRPVLLSHDGRVVVIRPGIVEADGRVVVGIAIAPLERSRLGLRRDHAHPRPGRDQLDLRAHVDNLNQVVFVHDAVGGGRRRRVVGKAIVVVVVPVVVHRHGVIRSVVDDGADEVVGAGRRERRGIPDVEILLTILTELRDEDPGFLARHRFRGPGEFFGQPLLMVERDRGIVGHAGVVVVVIDPADVNRAVRLGRRAARHVDPDPRDAHRRRTVNGDVARGHTELGGILIVGDTDEGEVGPGRHQREIPGHHVPVPIRVLRDVVRDDDRGIVRRTVDQGGQQGRVDRPLGGLIVEHRDDRVRVVVTIPPSQVESPGPIADRVGGRSQQTDHGLRGRHHGPHRVGLDALAGRAVVEDDVTGHDGGPEGVVSADGVAGADDQEEVVIHAQRFLADLDRSLRHEGGDQVIEHRRIGQRDRRIRRLAVRPEVQHPIAVCVRVEPNAADGRVRVKGLEVRRRQPTNPADRNGERKHVTLDKIGRARQDDEAHLAAIRDVDSRRDVVDRLRARHRAHHAEGTAAGRGRGAGKRPRLRHGRRPDTPQKEPAGPGTSELRRGDIDDQDRAQSNRKLVQGDLANRVVLQEVREVEGDHPDRLLGGDERILNDEVAQRGRHVDRDPPGGERRDVRLAGAQPNGVRGHPEGKAGLVSGRLAGPRHDEVVRPLRAAGVRAGQVQTAKRDKGRGRRAAREVDKVRVEPRVVGVERTLDAPVVAVQRQAGKIAVSTGRQVRGGPARKLHAHLVEGGPRHLAIEQVNANHGDRVALDIRAPHGRHVDEGDRDARGPQALGRQLLGGESEEAIRLLQVQRPDPDPALTAVLIDHAVAVIVEQVGKLLVDPAVRAAGVVVQPITPSPEGEAKEEVVARADRRAGPGHDKEIRAGKLAGLPRVDRDGRGRLEQQVEDVPRLPHGRRLRQVDWNIGAVEDALTARAVVVLVDRQAEL